VDAAAVTLIPGRSWTSPETGVRYPVSWELSIPSEDIHLYVDALVDDQEMDLSVNYWEGAVRVRGTRGGASISGRGYLEMTGYDAAGLSP
jgi:predicted secreted hydrolase